MRRYLDIWELAPNRPIDRGLTGQGTPGEQHQAAAIGRSLLLLSNYAGQVVPVDALKWSAPGGRHILPDGVQLGEWATVVAATAVSQSLQDQYRLFYLWRADFGDFPSRQLIQIFEHVRRPVCDPKQLAEPGVGPASD